MATNSHAANMEIDEALVSAEHSATNETGIAAPLAASVVATVAATTATGARGRHAGYGEIRGRRELFKLYFDTTDETGRKRRLSKAQQARRFDAYRRQVLRDYGTEITCKLSSEKAYNTRYSKPQRFLKVCCFCFHCQFKSNMYSLQYKLGRANNLDPEELTDKDLQYYLEIGGKLSLSELQQSLPFVESLGDASNTRRTRRRIEQPLEVVALPPVTGSAVPSLQSTFGFESMPESAPHSNSNNTRAIPAVPKEEEKSGEYAPALRVLHGKQTLYEQEQLEKREVEIKTLFKAKCAVISDLYMELLQNKPECIGFIPFCGAGRQDEHSFDFWLADNMKRIKESVADVQVLIQQLSSLLRAEQEWKLFLQTWKWQRICQENKFERVWDWMVSVLNIELLSDKREMDEDEDEDLDI